MEPPQLSGCTTPQVGVGEASGDCFGEGDGLGDGDGQADAEGEGDAPAGMDGDAHGDGDGEGEGVGQAARKGSCAVPEQPSTTPGGRAYQLRVPAGSALMNLFMIVRPTFSP